MIPAVVFDRDGVLTDFDIYGADRFFRQSLGVGLEELLIHWRQWENRSDFPVLAHQERAFVLEFLRSISKTERGEQNPTPIAEDFGYWDFIRAFDDAVPTLQKLRGEGVKIGVLSNFPLPDIRASLNAAGIGHLIDVAVASRRDGPRKPQAAAYLAICDQLETSPVDCIYVDDNLENVVGAQKVGMLGCWMQRTPPEDTVDTFNYIGTLDVIYDIAAQR